MMNFPQIDPRILAAGLLLAVAAIGLANLLRRRFATVRGTLLAHDFLEKLDAYVSSRGDDIDAYVWLTKNANAVQNLVGGQGYMDFRPPFQNYIVKNMPIVLNFLPMIRREFETFQFRDTSSINEYTRTLQESALRYLGMADARQKDLTKQLFNPVIWLREGTQLILSIPVRMFHWIGLTSAVTVSRIIHSPLFRVMAGLFALVGFVASVMTIILGWTEFKELIFALINR